MQKTKYKIVPAIRASVTIEAEYQKALLQLVREMRDSIKYYCLAAYKPIEAELKRADIIMDAKGKKPRKADFDKLKKILKAIAKRYQKRFDELAGKLPSNLINRINDNVSRRLKNALKDDLVIDYKFPNHLKMALQAATEENAALIKSIPRAYIKRVEYDLYSSVERGRDVPALVKKLEDGYGITRRKAIRLAFDQTNKITNTVDRHRKIELGLNYAIWRHSRIPLVPRKSHQKADGKEYDIRKGCYIDGEYIHPGQKINCGCYSQAILKFDEE